MTSLGPRRKRMGSPSSLRHVIRGGGFPVALHTSVAFSLSCTERSALVSSYRMSGGTETNQREVKKMFTCKINFSLFIFLRESNTTIGNKIRFTAETEINFS